MPVSALIFDFDGLLMDTETTLLESWRWEWDQHGLTLDSRGFFADHGGDVNSARYAALAAAVGAGYDREKSHARRTAYREELHRTLQPSPGIRAWFAEAGSLGLRVAVASSSPTAWVHDHLASSGLLPQVAVLACGDEVQADKPDPAVYLLALQRLSLPGSAAVAFEDTPHGVAAAQAAGLAAVAIPNPHTPAARFTTADAVLPSAAATSLTALLGRLTRSSSAGPKPPRSPNLK